MYAYAFGEGTVTEQLFVYGTLGPGRPNEYVLAPIGGSWQPATVIGTLKHDGWGAEMGYPGIILSENGGGEGGRCEDGESKGDEIVEGFLFTSENLSAHWERLDEFEGEGYKRVLTKVKLQDESITNAYIYTLAAYDSH